MRARTPTAKVERIVAGGRPIEIVRADHDEGGGRFQMPQKKSRPAEVAVTDLRPLQRWRDI
jgi:hypothetical protein